MKKNGWSIQLLETIPKIRKNTEKKSEKKGYDLGLKNHDKKLSD